MPSVIDSLFQSVSVYCTVQYTVPVLSIIKRLAQLSARVGIGDLRIQVRRGSARGAAGRAPGCSTAGPGNIRLLPLSAVSGVHGPEQGWQCSLEYLNSWSSKGWERSLEQWACVPWGGGQVF